MAPPDLAVAPVGVDPQVWDAACGAVRGFCRWHVAPSWVQPVVLDGPGGCELVLRTKHLTAVESVVNDGTPVDDVEWSEKGIVRLLGARWSRKLRSVSLTMTHGYDQCPPEILRILTDMVKLSAVTGAATMQAGPFGVTFTGGSAAAEAGAVGLSEAQKAVLLPYRLEPVF